MTLPFVELQSSRFEPPNDLPTMTGEGCGTKVHCIPSARSGRLHFLFKGISRSEERSISGATNETHDNLPHSSAGFAVDSRNNFCKPQTPQGFVRIRGRGS